MSANQADELLELFDKAPLNILYWSTMTLLALVIAIDFFDFFIVGFLVAVLAPEWGLTFGQSSIVLLSAGLGAIVGSLMWGAFSDAYGRRLALIISSVICGVASIGIAVLPEGAWRLFAALRFVIGFGIAGAATPTLALIVEYTPTRFRTVLPGFFTIFATVGTLLAALSASQLLSVLGWRGLAAIGALPAGFAVIMVFILPESVRWLASKGKIEDARKAVAKLLRLPLSAVPLPRAKGVEAPAPAARFVDLYAHPARFWLVVVSWLCLSTSSYGVYLWGPTIVAILMDVEVAKAAEIFIYAASIGIVGKTGFSLLPQWLGRRRCGQIGGLGIAVFLTGAALFHESYLWGLPVFALMLAMGALFYDGLFANLSPYSAEIFPVRLAGRGVGLAQAANGVGKIIGPALLGLIAGADTYISPKATADAVQPSFLALGFCGLVIALLFTFVRIETHAKPLDLN